MESQLAMVTADTMETGVSPRPPTMDDAMPTGMIPVIMTIIPVASSAMEITTIMYQATTTITGQDTGTADDAIIVTIAIKVHLK